MESSPIQRAVAVARSVAGELGFPVNDAVVLHNSDRIAVRLTPCDLLVRIAPAAEAENLQFEAEVAHRLAATDSPIGALAPGAEPRVYVRDAFAFTFWTYYAPVGEIAPAAYADALLRLHAGLRQIELAAPPITVRIASWAAEVDNVAVTPDLPAPDRTLLRNTFAHVRTMLSRWNSAEQLLHGEPHPANLLSTSQGPLFIDLQTCQRGPVEYDIAFLPEAAAIHYAGAHQALVHQFRILMWAGFTTMRWRSADQFPNRADWRVEGFNRLRTALARV